MSHWLWSPRVFGFQVVDIMTVGLGERGAFDKENVFSVELRAARKIVGAGDDGVVVHQNLVVHEIVAAGWTVGGGILSREMLPGDDFLQGGNLPMVRRNPLPLGVTLRLLGRIINAAAADPPAR